jgi:hypothetical protein
MKCVEKHKNNKEERMAENNTPYILYIKRNGTKRKKMGIQEYKEGKKSVILQHSAHLT